MDPDETLREMRQLRDEVEQNAATMPPAAVDLARVVAELDEWLAAGGFPPAAWAGPGVGIPPDVEDS